MAHARHGERSTMPAPIVPFKAGIVLLLGIVSAPVLKPLLDKTLKATVKAGIRVKNAVNDTASELKVVAAEAVEKKRSAENGSESDGVALAEF